MDIIQKINSIDFITFLSSLWYNEGVDFVLKWDLICMKEDWKKTDWWNWSVSKWFLKCHSWLKWNRIEWDRISLVEKKFSVSKKGAIDWICTTFNLKETKWKQLKSWHSFWDNLPNLSWEQDKYLKSRWIFKSWDYVKDLWWRIWLPIKTEWWNIVAVQGRDILWENPRYKIQSFSEWAKGIFFDKINPDKEFLFIVEWMADFLTIRQFTTNVVGIVSSTNWVNFLPQIIWNHTPIFISDLDEAWEKVKKEIQENIPQISLFDLSTFGFPDCNDVNDVWNKVKNELSWVEFLNFITQNSEKKLSNIELAINRAKENNTLWHWNIWDRIFDEATWWITPSTLMVINWFTWQWKTTTLDWIIKKLTEKHNKKIWYCSLDDDIGRVLAMFLWRKFKEDWRDVIYPNIAEYVKRYWIKKFDNLLFYDTIDTVEWFEKLIKDEELDVLVIDFIQDIPLKDWINKTEQMKEIPSLLYKIAKRNRCAIIALSQTSMSEWLKRVIDRNPSESFMICAKADTFINVWYFEDEYRMWFRKNKHWREKYKFSEFRTTWDKDTGDIKIHDE